MHVAELDARVACGVEVRGAVVARGMVLVSRSRERGRVLAGSGCEAEVDEGEFDGSVPLAVRAFSTHAARLE